jgi:hypothetical protein
MDAYAALISAVGCCIANSDFHVQLREVESAPVLRQRHGELQCLKHSRRSSFRTATIFA